MSNLTARIEDRISTKTPAISPATVAETTVVAAIAFILPFAIGGPQWIVGSLVNAALVYAALNMSGTRALPVVFMPSLAVLGRGVLFGALTPFLAIMIPFIWAANMLLVYSVRLMASRQVPLWLSVPAAAALKAGWLYAVASLLVGSGVLPAAMIQAMGLVQLLTALLGSGIAVAATVAVRDRSNS